MRSDSLLRKSVVNGKHTVFFAPVRAVTRYCPRASVPPRFAYAPILVFIGLRVGTASGVCGVARRRGRAGFHAAQARGGSDAGGARCRRHSGDEPGGFSAATLLITHYRIKKGTVWVVPNLNFPSIIQRSRGLHGDMNRKFAALAETDPEYATVRRIQELIRTPGLGLVLNLHDGGASTALNASRRSATLPAGGSALSSTWPKCPARTTARMDIWSDAATRPWLWPTPACSSRNTGSISRIPGRTSAILKWKKPYMVCRASRRARLWPGSQQEFFGGSAGLLPSADA